MSQMQASHARANFMTLPPELRNRIYELVLIANNGIERPDGSFMIEIADTSEEFEWSLGDDEIPSYYSTLAWCQQPFLTRVSRQIRSETLPIYYGANTFVAYVEKRGFFDQREKRPILSLENAHRWLATMPGSSRQLLKSLHVRLCRNVSLTGHATTAEDMASVLHKMSIDVPKEAITVWVAPEMQCPCRGSLEQWRKVFDGAEETSPASCLIIEEGLCQDLESWAPDLPFSWV